MSLFLAQPYHLGLDRLSLNSIDDQRAAIGAISNTDLVNALAAYTPTASLAPVALSGSATHLTTGTLADARLSSNVPLKNAANVFSASQIFNLGTEQIKLYGVSNFMTLFHTTDGNSGVFTNGFMSIKGSQITEPFDVTIAGHASYMFGIESDLGAVEPTVVLKTGGPFLRGYNGPNPAWFVESDGSQTIGQSNSSYFNVGRPSAGNSVTTITPGSISSVFNNEAHPRYRLTNNGFEHAIQGDFPASIVGVRFRCSAAGVASIDTNSDFSGYVQSLILNNNTATFRGSGTFNGNLIPGANATHDIGTSISMRWNRVFSNTLRVGSNGLEIGQNSYSVTLPRAEIGDLCAIGSVTTNLARLYIPTGASSRSGVWIENVAGQTAPPIRLANPAGVDLATINADGGATFSGVVNISGILKPANDIELASSSFIQRPDGNILLGWDAGGDYVAAGSNAGTARPLGIGANHTQISIRTGGVTRTKIFGNGNFQIGDNADNGALFQVFGTSNITGAAQFGSTLNVTGAATFSGQVTVNNDLVMTANTLLARQVRVSGAAGVQYSTTTPATGASGNASFMHYTANLADRLYLYDLINGRNQVTYLRGTTDALALAQFHSRVTVDNNLTVGDGTAYGVALKGNITGSRITLNPSGMKAMYSYADAGYAGWVNNNLSTGEYYYFGGGGHYFGHNGSNLLALTGSGATFSVNVTLASTKAINMSTGANTFTTFMGGVGNYEGYQHFQTNGVTNFWVHSTGTISRGTVQMLGDDVTLRAFDSAVSYLRFYGTGKSDCDLAGGSTLRLITSGTPRLTIGSTGITTVANALGIGVTPTTHRFIAASTIAGGTLSYESALISVKSNVDTSAHMRLIKTGISEFYLLHNSAGALELTAPSNFANPDFTFATGGTMVASSTIKLGNTSGVRLKNSSGVLQVRNDGDSAFANLEAATITATGRVNSGNGTSFGESGVDNAIRANNTYIISADGGNHARFSMTSAAAGAVFRLGWTTAHGGVSMESVPVAVGNTGYLAWFKPSGTRQGYIGYDGGNDITLKLEQAGGQFVVDGIGARIGLSGPLLKNSSGTLQVRNGSDTNFAIAHVGQLRVGPNASTVFSIESDSYISTRVSTAIAVGFIATNSLSQWASQVSPGGDWEVMQYAPSVFRRLWVTQGGEVYTQNQLTTASAVGNQSMRIRAIASQTGNLLQFLDVNSVEIGRITTTANMQLSGHITSAFQTLSADPSTIDIPSGSHRLVKNTTSGEIRDWVNDGGVMKKSPAYT